MGSWILDQVQRSYGGRSRSFRSTQVVFLSVTRVWAITWLIWDWQHARSLDAAEDAIFDRVVKLRPVEPKRRATSAWSQSTNARCSITYSRTRWLDMEPPRHADLLE